MTVRTVPFCKGKSRQTGEPCQLPPVPFADYCRFHGGNLPAQREKARKRMLEYELWSTDAAWLKALRLRQWQRSQRRWEMRRAKKRGPEYVAALKREWAAAETEKQEWFAENRRLRDQRRADYHEQQRKAGLSPTVPPEEPVSFIETGFDWSDL